MEHKISKAQLEVWEWKEKAYETIRHLSKKERMEAIVKNTKEAIRKINEAKKITAI
jgi:hypothetical protein